MTDPWDTIPEEGKRKSIMKEENIPNITDDNIIESNFKEPLEDLFIEEANTEINTVIKKEKKKIDIDTVLDEDSISDKFKKEGKIIVSFSLIDKMFFKGDEIPHCPCKIKAYIDGIQEPPTDPMKAGSLFETLLLGSGRDGAQTLQLDRKQVSQKAKNEAIKKGLPEPEPEMRIDEIRIRHQVEKSKVIFFNHKVNVIPNINTQVPIYKLFADDILVQGHIDLFPTPVIWNGEERIAIIDTKLTGNLSSSFGKYCWGTPEFIDFTQGLVYLYLVDDIDYSINPYLLTILGKERQFRDVIFLYFVADYKVAEDKLQHKFVEVAKTDDRMREVKETIRKCAENIRMYQAQSWPENPSFELCKNCLLNYKLNGPCLKAINNQII